MIERFFKIKNGIFLCLLLVPFYLQIQWVLSWHPISRLWHNFFILLLFAATYCKFCVDPKYRSHKINSLDIICFLSLLYGCAQVVNTYYERNWFTALNGFRLFYFGNIFYFVVRLYVRKKESIITIFKTMFVLTLVASIEQVIEFIVLVVFHSTKYLPWISNAPEIFRKQQLTIFGIFLRPYGLIGTQQLSACFIGIGLMLFLVFHLNQYSGGKYRLSKKITYYFMLLALLLTTSRTGVVSFLISFFLASILYLNFLKIFKLSIGVLVLFSLLFLFEIGLLLRNLNIDVLWQYMVFDQNDGFFASFSLESRHESMSIVQYLIGVGFPSGAFESGLGLNTKIERPNFFGLSDHHSALIEIFQYTGLIGGSLFIMQAGVAFFYGHKFGKKEGLREYKYLFYGLALAVFSLFVSTAHYGFFKNPCLQTYYYCLLGLLGALPTINKNEKKGLINERIAD